MVIVRCFKREMLRAAFSKAAAAHNMRRGIVSLHGGLFSAVGTRPVSRSVAIGSGAMARQMSSGSGEARLQGYQHNVFLTLSKNLQNVPARVLAANLRMLLETNGELTATELRLAVRALGKVGDAELTRKVLDKFLHIDALDAAELGAVHGAVIKTLCANGLHDDALSYFHTYADQLNEMHAAILFKGLKGPQPDDASIQKALQLVLSRPSPQQFDVISYAALFSLCGMASTEAAPDVLAKALKVFNLVTASGVMAGERVLYNSLLLLAAKAKDAEAVETLLEKMKANSLTPSPATFSSLLVGAAHAGNHADAVQIGRQLAAAEGYVMDNAVMHAFLQSCKHVSEHQLAIDVFQKWKAVPTNVPTPKILLAINHHASKTGSPNLIKHNWKTLYPQVSERDSLAGKEIFTANTVWSLLRADAYSDAVQIAEALELSKATVQTWFSLVRAMVERQDWHSLLALSGRFEYRADAAKFKTLVQRVKAGTIAAMFARGENDRAEAFYKATTSAMDGSSADLLHFHSTIAATLPKARASHAAPRVLAWHSSLLHRLGASSAAAAAAADKEDVTLDRLGECLAQAAETAESSGAWADLLHQVYELQPSDSARTLVAYACRSQADFDRFFSTFQRLERADVAAVARALSFASQAVVDSVVNKLRQLGVDVDANLTLQAVLSLKAAQSGTIDAASKHLAAALEQLQVTSPGPMGFFVVSQLAQSLVLQQQYEAAFQLVQQTLPSDDLNSHVQQPDRMGERQLVSDLVDALLKARQGEFLERVLAQLDTPAVAPVTFRGGALVAQLPSLKANLAFIFHHLSHRQQLAEGETGEEVAAKGARVIFPCHLGFRDVSEQTIHSAVVEVLRTYPYQNAAFRVASKHRDRFGVSSIETPLGGIPLEVRLQVPPTVVSGLQDKRKVRDKSHRKDQEQGV